MVYKIVTPVHDSDSDSNYCWTMLEYGNEFIGVTELHLTIHTYTIYVVPYKYTYHHEYI